MEVLVSLIIFTVGMTAAFALLINSVRLNSINKNRIIAVNLAQEGLEVVKNIRDTNWLVYSANQRDCWNFSPDTDENGSIEESDACSPDGNGQNNHPIGVLGNGAGNTKIRTYIADFDASNNRWMLLPADEYINTTVSPEIFSPYDGTTLNGAANGSAISPATFDDRTPQLYLTANNRYTHLPASNTVSPFLRVIDICYIDNVAAGESCNTSGLFPTASSSGDPNRARDNRLQITARVYWKETASDSVFKSVVLQTTLTDYLGRNNWTE